MDGIARVIDQLDSVFNNFKTFRNSCSAAFIDLRKIFDSISFDSIYSALAKLNVPFSFSNYIKFVNLNTYLQFNGTFSESISPNRGVCQGDPLSSKIFLIIFDFILRSLPD